MGVETTLRGTRVLMIASWYPSEARPLWGIFIKEQAQELARHVNLAVLHVDYTAVERYVEIDTDDGYPVVRVGSPVAEARGDFPTRLRELYDRTVRLMSAAKLGVDYLRSTGWGTPELLHAQVLYPAGFIAERLARRLLIPYVVTEHAAEYGGSGVFRNRNRSVRWLITRAAARASTVIAVSSYLERAMRSNGLQAEYAVVPNMVPVGDRPPHASANPRRFINVSLLVDRLKNLSGLIRACRLLVEREEPPFLCSIVGDGEDRNMLESMASELSLLGTYVEFRGQLSHSETYAAIEAAAFTVCSSPSETFSMALAETLTCGRPVVAVAGSGPDDFVRPDVGILIESATPEALADALHEMLTRAQDYDTEAIKEYARERFSPAGVAESILEVYERAIAGQATAMR